MDIRGGYRPLLYFIKLIFKRRFNSCIWKLLKHALSLHCVQELQSLNLTAQVSFIALSSILYICKCQFQNFENWFQFSLALSLSAFNMNIFWHDLSCLVLSKMAFCHSFSTVKVVTLKNMWTAAIWPRKRVIKIFISLNTFMKICKLLISCVNIYLRWSWISRIIYFWIFQV